jgi:plastocyanin
MNNLDSRALRYGNRFSHQFKNEGTYEYTITIGKQKDKGDFSGKFEVVVQPRPASPHSDPVQKIVTIGLSELQVAIDPSDGVNQTIIKVDDVITWLTNDNGLPGITIIASGGAFNSEAMTDKVGYSHTFGLPGIFDWIDANHGDAPEVLGRVTVVQPQMLTAEHRTAWFAKLKEDTPVIKINKKNVDPKELSIHVGQTVVWQIQSASGISITDKRLIIKKNQ